MGTITVDKEFIQFVKNLHETSERDLKMTFAEYVLSQMPEGPKKVASTMNNAGHKIYLVGGAVRDTLKAYNEQNERLEEIIAYCKEFEEGMKTGKIKIGDTLQVK